MTAFGYACGMLAETEKKRMTTRENPLPQTRAEYDSALREAVDRLVERFGPEKIILFGSQARGGGGPESDADLLVIMPVNGSKRQQAVAMDLALEGIPIPIDLIVATPDELERDREAMGVVIREAVDEGKVLYERAA
jgi:predicted nucleotidyltransferase